MNRRAFLQALGFGTVAAAAAATSMFDVERLLWVPGEKTIFLPQLRGEPFSGWVTREWLRVMKVNLQFAAHVNRNYDEMLRGLTTTHAHTIEIKLPARFRVGA